MMKKRILLNAALAFSLFAACEPDVVPLTDENSDSQLEAIPGTVGYLDELSKPAAEGQQTKRALSLAVFSETSYNLNTDFASFGTGVKESGTGTIEVTGITGTINAAYLYWHGNKNSVKESSVNVNGTTLTGQDLGYSGSNCWQFLGSQTLKADITELVKASGNGSYALKYFENLVPNGASILVFYEDGDLSNNRDIALIEGNDSNVDFPGIAGNPSGPEDPSGWNASFPSISYNGGTAWLQLHVSDGQPFAEQGISLNAETVVPSGFLFDGELGNFWDIKTYDIGSFLETGNHSLELTSGTYEDCLSLVLAIVNVPTATGNNDPDGDGVLDDSDNCPLAANADQLDTDADGQGDACDPDDDNDTVSDESDNCPLTANADQLDTDSDAQGDACDPDDDNDGVLDEVDNCPLVSNAAQEDFDGDGLGDACDPDDDNDGVADESDLFPHSNMEAIVNIGGCDTGLENQSLGEGVFFSDLVDELEAEEYKNQGQEVKAFTHLTNEWIQNGLITGKQRSGLLKCVQQ